MAADTCQLLLLATLVYLSMVRGLGDTSDSDPYGSSAQPVFGDQQLLFQWDTFQVQLTDTQVIQTKACILTSISQSPYDKRFYVSFPKLNSDCPVTVAVLESASDLNPVISSPKLIPVGFTDLRLYSVWKIHADERSRLWILDDARIGWETHGTGPKLVVYSLASMRINNEFDLSGYIHTNKSLLVSMAVDSERDIAYIGDAGLQHWNDLNPVSALIVVCLTTGEARRVLEDASMLRVDPEIGLTLFGTRFRSEFAPGIWALGLSTGGNRLFLSPFASSTMASIQTASLQNFSNPQFLLNTLLRKTQSDCLGPITAIPVSCSDTIFPVAASHGLFTAVTKASQSVTVVSAHRDYSWLMNAEFAPNSRSFIAIANDFPYFVESNVMTAPTSIFTVNVAMQSASSSEMCRSSLPADNLANWVTPIVDEAPLTIVLSLGAVIFVLSISLGVLIGTCAAFKQLSSLKQAAQPSVSVFAPSPYSLKLPSTNVRRSSSTQALLRKQSITSSALSDTEQTSTFGTSFPLPSPLSYQASETTPLLGPIR